MEGAIGKQRPRPIERSETETDGDLRRLVDAAITGEEQAFRRLYERFAPRVYVYAHVRLGDREAARDLVQEVFTEVWRRLPGFENRHPLAFPGWLFTIARNSVVDRLRRRRYSSVPLDEGMGESVEFEGEAISRRLVVELLEPLPALQREVVVMRFIAGMSLAEVAAALRKREGAVVQLQLRGLRRIRKELAKE